MQSIELAIYSAYAGPFGWLLIPSSTVFFLCIAMVTIRQFLRPNHRLQSLSLRSATLVSFSLVAYILGNAHVGSVVQNTFTEIYEERQSETAAPDPLMFIPASSKAVSNSVPERPSAAVLEREFFDAYVPPDGCQEAEIKTKDMLIDCTNERGRAKREFMAKHRAGG